jgi:hypothetical protein
MNAYSLTLYSTLFHVVFILTKTKLVSRNLSIRTHRNITGLPDLLFGGLDVFGVADHIVA